MRNIFYTILGLFLLIGLFGWGVSGHKIINRKIPLSFPLQMAYYTSWTDSLQRHGSDADYRKSWDSTESRKHYIDIDNYPSFITSGRIPQTLDSLYMIYGWNFVSGNGILPFAVKITVDSIKNAFQRRDFQKAMLHSADLGHYVGDAHNPLHLTRNYDGQYSNQTGIHSRYETQLINRDSADIIYGGDSAFYINDVQSYAFQMVYNNYIYVDSVLKYDSIAYYLGGNNYGMLYYQYYWAYAKAFTLHLFKKASNSTASLIYTAWINAGSPTPVSIKKTEEFSENFELYQNYPNPFNSSTVIKFNISKEDLVRLSIFDNLGREIGVPVNNKLKPGSYQINFNAENLSSGIYYYMISAGNFKESRKMILLR